VLVALAGFENPAPPPWDPAIRQVMALQEPQKGVLKSKTPFLNRRPTGAHQGPVSERRRRPAPLVTHVALRRMWL
jgi:hypothetical protein